MKRAELVIFALVVLLMMTSAQAQVTIEIAQITCKQFLAFSVADPRDIAIWLSGYYHGKRSDTVQTQELKANYEKLKSGFKADIYCAGGGGIQLRPPGC